VDFCAECPNRSISAVNKLVHFSFRTS